MGQDMIKDIIEQNNFLFVSKTDKDIIKQTKLTIISLAYTDSLSVKDLMELSEILETIAGYKSSTNKKKGL